MYWRLISEAPHDGRLVLLGGKLYGQDVAAVGVWHNGKWNVTGKSKVSLPNWTPTHFCRWETPATVAEIEKADAAEVRKQLDLANYSRFCNEIIWYCYCYYVKSRPVADDQTFDRMYAELQSMEREMDGVDPTSPTQMIYGDVEFLYPDWVVSKWEKTYGKKAF